MAVSARRSRLGTSIAMSQISPGRSFRAEVRIASERRHPDILIERDCISLVAGAAPEVVAVLGERSDVEVCEPGVEIRTLDRGIRPVDDEAVRLLSSVQKIHQAKGNEPENYGANDGSAACRTDFRHGFSFAQDTRNL